MTEELLAGEGMLIENTTGNALTVTQNNLMGNNCGRPSRRGCGVVANPFATKEFKVQLAVGLRRN